MATDLGSSFTEVSVVTDGEAAEAISEVLRPYAYQEGVVLEQRGDPDSLDPLAMEPQVTVKIYVPAAADTPAWRQRVEESLYHLNRLYPIPAPEYKLVEEKDWANAWKEHYHPFRVGKHIWIRPSWYDDDAFAAQRGNDSGEGAIVLILDPGMAFGTGLHPTTQKCLVALEETVNEGDSVLDVGTGSGVLSVAAARLGAQRVLGVDTDPMAVRTAQENAIANGVSDKTAFVQGQLADLPRGVWDIVVVNILAPVIIELLEQHELLSYVSASGWLVLSGIIDAQAEDVEAAVRRAGGQVRRRLVVRDWLTLLVQPLSPAD